jgi:serine/threonine protein kinase
MRSKSFLARSPQLNTEATGTAPDAFGPFRVLHQIGAGTLGPVFRGHDTQRDRLVAVKVFKLDMAPERVHQLLGELEHIVAQLAFALDHAAIADIAHGALHPRDVLMSTTETRLTGIGVAQALEKVGVPIPVRRPYTAPELVADGTWDRRADVFSLAAIVYELIWGRRISGAGAPALDGLSEVAGADLATIKTVFGRALG